jgi:hypothetical protein
MWFVLYPFVLRRMLFYTINPITQPTMPRITWYAVTWHCRRPLEH